MNSSPYAPYPQTSPGGLLDNPHATLRSNYQPTSISQKANEDFTFEGVYGNRQDEETVFESTYNSASTAKFPLVNSLIDALIPLNIFLRTDCVKLFIPSTETKEEVLIQQTNYDPSSSYSSHTDPTISDWKIVINGKLIEPFAPTPQLMQDYLDFLGEPGLSRPRFFPPFPEFSLEDPKSYTDDEIVAAGQFSPFVPLLTLLVKSGTFEISVYTPINSLLKIWSVACADYSEDHVTHSSYASSLI